MKKGILLFAIFFVTMTGIKSFGQNMIMLKDKMRYDQPGYEQMELIQAKIISGYIYTLESFSVTLWPDSLIYYSKYDLNGNLIKRKPFPVMPKWIHFIPGGMHIDYRNIDMYLAEDSTIVCYIPYINSRDPDHMTYHAIYKYNMNLDSVRLIVDRVRGMKQYTSSFLYTKGGYTYERILKQTADHKFLLLCADSSSNLNDTMRFKIRKLDEQLNTLWTTFVSDKLDSTDLMKYEIFRNSSSLTSFEDKYYFARLHLNDSYINEDSSCYFTAYITVLNENGSIFRNDSFTLSGDLCHLHTDWDFTIHSFRVVPGGYTMNIVPDHDGFNYAIKYDTASRQMTSINTPLAGYQSTGYADPYMDKGYVKYFYWTSGPVVFYNYNNDHSSAVLNQQSVKPVPDSFSIYYPNRFQKVIRYRNTWVDENPDTSYLLLGVVSLQDSGDYMTIIPLTSIFGNYSGKVYKDNNTNCVPDSSIDSPYANRVIEVTKTNSPLPFRYYGQTNASGRFEIFTDTGQFSARVVLPSNRWYSCPVSQTFTIGTHSDSVVQNFLLQRLLSCPGMNVSISSSRLRPCFNSTYYVRYCNSGTTAASNATVKVELDSAIHVYDATVPYTSNGYAYIFQIGNIPEDSCGTFSFNVTLDCSVLLGSTVCVKAHIYPDTICTPVNPLWNGAQVTVDGRCAGDSVLFTISNVGTGNMTQPKNYVHIENDSVSNVSGSFQLNSGQHMRVAYASNSNTHRIIAEQVDYFPYPSTPTAFVEGCGGFVPGFANQFPFDDGADFIDEFCVQSVGSYDPNEKEASPSGRSSAHLIPKNTPIEYTIHFQNTGTDTAYDVYILDTISPKLDISTLRMGASSHPYIYKIYGEGYSVLKVEFHNINLVDSFHNESLSHGFFTYSISQDTANEMNDEIHNKAYIYFDANQPVVTNQTLHTVGKDFINADITTAVKNPKFNIKNVRAFPNPFRDKTQIIVDGDLLKSAILQILNIDGKIVKSISSSNGNSFDFYREDLSKGIYIYKILQDKEEVANGKIVIQ